MSIKKNQLYTILCIILLIVILVSFFVIWIYVSNNLQAKTIDEVNLSNDIYMDSEGCNQCYYVTNMDTGEKKEVCTQKQCIVNGKSVYDQ